MTEMALRCKMKRAGQNMETGVDAGSGEAAGCGAAVGCDTAAGTGVKADTDVKVSLISKIAYGMGDVGCNFSWMFVGNFLMIFYTDVFGISMGAVAGLMLFSRFWDAVNDPIIGSLTDRTHSRWGRYRPWLLAAAPLTAIVLILTFWAHPGWNSTAKVVYMAITYCILVLGYTCVNIPYGTLCGAMTQNIEERAQINTFRSVAAMIAIGIINIITVPLIETLGAGSDRRGYLLIAVIYGGIFALCHIFCFAKTKEVVAVPERKKISLKEQLGAVSKNRPYILALAGQLLFGFTLYGRNADALYYFTYVEGNKAFFTVYSMCIIIPSIIGAACFPMLFHWTNNKGWAASIFAFLTGMSMMGLGMFTVKESPVLFYGVSALTQFSFPGLTQPSMPSSRIVWNMGSGRPDCATMDSSMPLYHLATRWAWLLAPRFWPWSWGCADMWPGDGRTLPFWQ